MGSRVRFVAVAFVVALVAVGSAAPAELRLPAILGDNMVVQQASAVPIWGWADAGKKVTVTFAGQSVSATAGQDGRWQAKLAALKVGEPGEMTVAVAGGETKTLKNVLVGEVWVCSGQSNMAMSLRGCNNSAEETAAAKYPKIRLFTVGRLTSRTPQADCKGQWVECSPQTAGGFSGVGYFFGRHVHKNVGVPVGLVNTSWGGTPSEAWTSRPALEAEPFFKPLLERWDARTAGWDADKAKAAYAQRLEQWKKAAAKAKAAKKRPPRRPRAPGDPARSPHCPASLYNGMIAPLIPLAFRGAIWYQGESNAGRAWQYRKLFPAMIVDWRKNWGQGDFSFFWVQLANFKARKAEPAESEWAELREAQTLTLQLPRTGQAVIIDIGNARNVHPKNKQDVGKRLGLAARKVAYAEKLCFSGPTYESLKIEGGKAIVKFKNVCGGLVAKGGEPLKGFAVAGADKKFVWADAKIAPSPGAAQAADTVVVSSEKVAAPVAVRYAWADNPDCNLYNAKADLPACPFRTDDWPMITKDKH